MGRVVESIYIEASPEHVFDLSVDATRLPEYWTNITEVREVSGPLNQVGARYTAIMKIGGRKLEAEWEVVRVERPTYLETRGMAPGGGRASFITRRMPKGNGTESTTELTYELPAGFLGELADKLFVEKSIERDVRHTMENFKALCEVKVPTPA